ncbi:MAG: hypothetical protein JWO67_7390, partial [Streptosporangiaceae bacterium]|nr:hypothetical protein [Streptosporangiaceae bacterium]
MMGLTVRTGLSRGRGAALAAGSRRLPALGRRLAA